MATEPPATSTEPPPTTSQPPPTSTPPPPTIAPRRKPPHKTVVRVPLDLTFRSRLRKAHITLWIDGEERFTKRLEVGFPRRVFGGRSFEHHLEVPAGRRLVEVHLSGIEPDFEARRQVRRNFIAGEPQTLSIHLVDGELRLHFQETTQETTP
jgi:hypothetical protein